MLVHVAVAAAFFYLLSFRDVEAPREVVTTVDVVQEPPKPAGAPVEAKPMGSPGAGKGTGGPAGGAQQATGPKTAPTKPIPPDGAPVAAPSPPPPPKPPTPDEKLAAALAPPAASPSLPPPAPTPSTPPGAPPAPSAGEAAPPKLVEPPPEAARSATQDKENKPADLVPDEHQTDQATHEAKPVAVPQALTTSDAKAAASVASPVKPQNAPVEKPTPPIPATAPSAADKLAAALPMDASAMPMSFRSVLAGNAAAQINAAYAGVIQGRIRQAQTELAQTAFAQRMSGNVAISFTIDDAGRLSRIAIAQSSGNAQLDALALHAIELAAPFPPPPPEADHTFNKAFLVGG